MIFISFVTLLFVSSVVASKESLIRVFHSREEYEATIPRKSGFFKPNANPQTDKVAKEKKNLRSARTTSNSVAFPRSTVSADCEHIGGENSIPYYEVNVPWAKNGLRFIGCDPQFYPNGTARIVVSLIPVVMKFTGFADHDVIIDARDVAIPNMLASPFFNKAPFEFTPEGGAQFMDAMQRCAFHLSESDWHLIFEPYVAPPLYLTVTPDNGTLNYNQYGDFYSGAITTNAGINFFQHISEGYLKEFADIYFPSNGIPAFVLQDNYLGKMGGYHSAVEASETRPLFPFISCGWHHGFDNMMFAHEFAEAINDPFLDNELKYSWEYPHIGGEQRCAQTLMEVTDPFESTGPNTTPMVSANSMIVDGQKFTYQNSFFYSWFSGDPTKKGCNNGYTYPMRGALNYTASLCVPGLNTISPSAAPTTIAPSAIPTMNPTSSVDLLDTYLTNRINTVPQILGVNTDTFNFVGDGEGKIFTYGFSMDQTPFTHNIYALSLSSNTYVSFASIEDPSNSAGQVFPYLFPSNGLLYAIKVYNGVNSLLVFDLSDYSLVRTFSLGLVSDQSYGFSPLGLWVSSAGITYISFTDGTVRFLDTTNEHANYQDNIIISFGYRRTTMEIYGDNNGNLYLGDDDRQLLVYDLTSNPVTGVTLISRHYTEVSTPFVDGVDASAASFNIPLKSLVLDTIGSTIYFVSDMDNVISVFGMNLQSRTVYRLAGSPDENSCLDNDCSARTFFLPNIEGLAFDAYNNLLIMTSQRYIRRISSFISAAPTIAPTKRASSRPSIQITHRPTSPTASPTIDALNNQLDDFYMKQTNINLPPKIKKNTIAQVVSFTGDGQGQYFASVFYTKPDYTYINYLIAVNDKSGQYSIIDQQIANSLANIAFKFVFYTNGKLYVIGLTTEVSQLLIYSAATYLPITTFTFPPLNTKSFAYYPKGLWVNNQGLAYLGFSDGKIYTLDTTDPVDNYADHLFLKDFAYGVEQLDFPITGDNNGFVYVSDPASGTIWELELTEFGATYSGITSRRLSQYFTYTDGMPSIHADLSPSQMIVNPNNRRLYVYSSYHMYIIHLTSYTIYRIAGYSQDSVAGIDGPSRSATLFDLSGMYTDGERVYFVDRLIDTFPIRYIDYIPAGSSVSPTFQPTVFTDPNLDTLSDYYITVFPTARLPYTTEPDYSLNRISATVGDLSTNTLFISAFYAINYPTEWWGALLHLNITTGKIDIIDHRYNDTFVANHPGAIPFSVLFTLNGILYSVQSDSNMNRLVLYNTQDLSIIRSFFLGTIESDSLSFSFYPLSLWVNNQGIAYITFTDGSIYSLDTTNEHDNYSDHLINSDFVYGFPHQTFLLTGDNQGHLYCFDDAWWLLNVIDLQDGSSEPLNQRGGLTDFPDATKLSIVDAFYITDLAYNPTTNKLMVVDQRGHLFMIDLALNRIYRLAGNPAVSVDPTTNGLHARDVNISPNPGLIFDENIIGFLDGESDGCFYRQINYVPPITSVPTFVPTTSPMETPTAAPITRKPTNLPTVEPTESPTETPTAAPVTFNPTKTPTAAPSTRKPTRKPTRSPTRPTASPTKAPSFRPTTRPPTAHPTAKPTTKPTKKPTPIPTTAPTTADPTETPTRKPTKAPTWKPSPTPTKKPTKKPTPRPTENPSRKPTIAPSRPTQKPSISLKPSFKPTRKPSISLKPSFKPTTEK
jgi:hypothetical protein